MNAQPMQGYAVDGHSQEYISLGRGPMRNQARDGYAEQPTDHLSVGGMASLLEIEMRKLFEEVAVLRERLAPVLADQKTPPLDRRPNLPTYCKLAAEMTEIATILQNTREMVSLTLSQLDI